MCRITAQCNYCCTPFFTFLNPTFYLARVKFTVMRTTAIRFISIFTFLLCSGITASAQFSFGPKVYTRIGDDRVGNTAGVGLSFNILYYDSTALTGIFGGGFDVSFPQKFSGTATMDAVDSSASPFTVTVPVNMQVTDYFLHFEGGFSINPKRKPNALILTLGLRPLYRRIKIHYPDSFDESLYSRYTLETSPDIPAALNIGFNIGVGYLVKTKPLAFYPHVSFGFGTADSRNKHPWNKYPNYVEAGITILFVTRID